MCKTNIKTYLYYANICKHEYEKNVIMLWCKIILQINVELIKGNEGSYFYLYPFAGLVQRSFQRGFYVCIKQRSFLRSFLIMRQL